MMIDQFTKGASIISLINTDKQTDEMVYTLYGLTDEEIAVVEGREEADDK